MRPAGKARRPRISGIFEGGATQPDPGSPTRQPRWGGGGMHRRSNADGVAPWAANSCGHRIGFEAAHLTVSRFDWLKATLAAKASPVPELVATERIVER